MKLHLNLASRVYINRRMLNLVYAALIALLGLFLFFNVSGLVHLHRHSRQIEGMLSQIPERRSGSQQADLLRSADTLAKRVGVANEILKGRRFHWSSFLDRMESILPEGVRLRSIQPDARGGTVRLQGVARDVPELRSFLERLSADPQLANYFLLEQALVRGSTGEGELPEMLRFSLQLKGVF